ncbi:Pentatricopeptide repeat-containing protein [Quillaja saponaria]|uniref:Pentatricopeptide repeat-containing protein n=1 Tax=Quillaja saponaria TaxID=32244 RepID=A0AAD7LBG7_QUISA|nr:Pentatricopeptide repeat-containing protein [Quillaja saponaria]
MKVHALIVVLGYQSFVPVSNSLIDMYGKCLNPSGARKVFDEMNGRNEVTWCSLIYAYTKSGQFASAHEVFHNMPKRVEIAWNTMIAGYAHHGEVEVCFELFREMQESPYQPDQWTLSSLMNACAESLETIYGCLMHGFIIKSGWESAAEIRTQF